MELTLDAIIQESELAFQQFARFCTNTPDSEFFQAHNGKWSIAQHLQHLIISTKTSTAAYGLPKFMLLWVAGKPNRPSRSFEELVEKYKKKLAEGGKAKGRYVPGNIDSQVGKNNMIAKWITVTGSYLKTIKKNYSDQQLDKYIVPHPLLGKITLRELCYFTIYHTLHHLKNLKSSGSSPL